MTIDLAAETAWMADAACRGLTRLMYPPMRQGRAPQDGVYDEALAICAACPVVDDCRAWAETQPDQWRSTAVIGGLTPAQRPGGACGQLLGEPGGHRRHVRAGEDPCDPCRRAKNAQNAAGKRARRREQAA